MKVPLQTPPWLGLLALMLIGCDSDSVSSQFSSQNDPPQAAVQGPNPLGGPIAGLTPDELAAFNRGKIQFERRFTPRDGLGPFYNATSCSSCHSTPVTGGSSGLYRNFYVGVYGTLSSQGALPPFLSPIIPSFGTGEFHMSANFSLEGGRTRIPDMQFGLPVIVAQRNATPIFGVGLFETISNATILANADPFDTNSDGITGRHNVDMNGDLGRFGQKAQSNSIEVFTRAPLQTQMGITSDPFLGKAGTISMARAAVQATTDPNAPTTDNDGIPDPEMDHDDLGDLIAFTRFLAPPQPQPFDAEAMQGEILFDQVGCTGCHIPSLQGSDGPVQAYTDLLLHFMGNELADGIRFGSSGITSLEFRTAPLWGVSLSKPFLHDGRAETLDEAIMAHGGEALNAKNAYLALPTQAERDAIISFLEHL